MTLAPDGRVLLTDALRPPVGYRVDVAVGTTYSLDLTALLLAPLAFALYDARADIEPTQSDPIRLLEAARRHSEHTTMFCQAGSIHVPTDYRSILTYVEDSVREVAPPRPNAIFHPKIWALRFVNGGGDLRHRLVCLSRNMTMDRSWDTALLLDEAADGSINARPAATFIRELPGLCLRPMTGDGDEQRVTDIADLADTLGRARLAPPEPFTGGELVPMGVGRRRKWSFPDTARKVLAISPFIDSSTIAALGTDSAERTILSRAESLDQVGSDALQGWDINVLQRLAEITAEDEVGEPSAALTEFERPDEGLHAKTFVLDLPGRQSMTVTGSANLTRAGWTRNVEFDVVLTGPTRHCGVRSVLDGSVEAPGLTRMLQQYTVSNAEGLDDAQVEAAYRLEQFHQQLAAASPTLQVQSEDEDRVTADLRLDIPDDPPGITNVWLASLGQAQTRDLHESLRWTIAPVNVTPFIAVETIVGDGDDQVSRRCVLVARLTGRPGDRRQLALADVLRSQHDVLRYLIFLLGDPADDALLAEMAGAESGPARPFDGTGWEQVALFEPLVRATGRDLDAIARVAALIDELRELPNGAELVPDEFDDLWNVVWQVHQERTR